VDINNIKTIHFVGIGGIGISAVAKLLLLQGKEIRGSDISESEILDELRGLGITIFVGHKEDNLSKKTDFVVYSSAVTDSNPEREKAKRENIPQMSYFEFLGEISRNKKTIAVSGTHGKSTTTAMLGLMFEAAGLDPTVIVGSRVNDFPYKNLRFGKSDWMIVEACEHFKNFLHLYPQYLIINNVELDHTDFYKNLDDVEGAFATLAQKLPPGGFLLFNADSQGAAMVYKKLEATRVNITTEKFGLSADADWIAANVSSTEGGQKFEIKKNNRSMGDFILKVPGRFNIYNALAAASMAMRLGVPSGVIRKVLSEFTGIWRRFEKVGEIKRKETRSPRETESRYASNIIVISDYGHHPTAIRETIKAARDFYPMRRIVLAFQPHQHNRTKNLFNDFVDALAEVDLLILSDIFDVAGREEKTDQNINSYNIIDTMRKKYPQKNKNLIYGGNLKKTTEEILKNLSPNDLLIIMGAGDIYTIIPQIIKK